MSLPNVTRYGLGLDGTRRFAVEVQDGVRVLVEPTGSDNNDPAEAWAAKISDQAIWEASAAATIKGLRNERDALVERIGLLERRLAEQRTIAEAAVAGRRRFFGPVLLVPVVPGDWSREVWLLDPVKGFRGRGLRFASLAEVRSLHPELWIVGTTESGVLLDAHGEVTP